VRLKGQSRGSWEKTTLGLTKAAKKKMGKGGELTERLLERRHLGGVVLSEGGEGRKQGGKDAFAEKKKRR